ncbi:MAG TPA: ATP-binding cassette domain-containing protein [Acidimicrobiales bacterium]|nr:ATP-binding cassette domain-containing protein [Acidimicrobiales bacterium]
MTRVLVFAFLSIPLIGAFGMFSLGIVVIYRASRVLNLAHGAMAMAPAYAYYSLTELGLPPVVALVLGVAVGAALGVGVEWAFVRRLRRQGPTAQTVGTVAVTGLLIALVGKLYGTGTIAAPTIFPADVLRVGGAGVRIGDLGLLVCGIAACAALFAFLQFTEFGLAMRGAAQNRAAALLMGIDPNRAASAAWALGGGLAAFAGILLASVTNLSPYTLSLQVLPAFVAALIGGLESLPGAMGGSVVAGLAFGIVPAMSSLPGFKRIFQLTGAPQLVLTVLAVAVMVTRGRRFSGSDSAEAGLTESTGGGASGDRTRTAQVALVCGVALLVAWPWLVPFSVLGSSLLAIEYAVIAVSLVLLTGWVGQISLAHASFVGLGALMTGMAARELGIGFPLNVIAGVVAASAVATGLGAVALRVRGLYLAVATLIFAWMADAFLFQSPWVGIKGGNSTIPNQHIGRPGGFPSLDLTNRRAVFLTLVVVLVLVIVGMANLRDTRTGRAFSAVRGSEMAAAALGIDVVRYKLVAFALSGALAGLGGALIMVEQRTVVPSQFLFTVSLQYLAIAVVGGLASLPGAVAAGVVFASLNEVFFRVDFLSGWLDVVSAALLALVLLAYPGGLAAGGRRLRAAIRVVEDRVEARVEPLAESVAAWLRRRRERGAEVSPADAPSEIAEAPSSATFDWYTRARGPTAEAAPADGDAVHLQTETPRMPLSFAARDPLAPVPRADRTLLLEASGIEVRFGGLTAVADASLEVREGEIVGLIGPNGAGKTTLFNAVLGLNEPAAGTITMYGRDVTALPAHVRAAMGVARTFQVLQLFNELTVFDNLLVATHLQNDSGLFANLVASSGTLAAENRARRRVQDVLELLALEGVADEYARNLPFGILRMVELGRALVTGAGLMLLDEAASGLNDAETDRLMDVVRGVRDLGVSVLLIEHDVRMVTKLSDYVYVLDQGRMLAHGEPDSVRRHPGVIAAYLGAEATAPEQPRARRSRLARTGAEL